MADNKKNDFTSQGKSVDWAIEIREIKDCLKNFVEIVSSSQVNFKILLEDISKELKQTNEKLVKEYENRVVDLEKSNEILVKAIDSIAKLTKSEENLKNEKNDVIERLNELQAEKERIQQNAERDKKQAEDYRNKTVVKITELQEKLDTANQSVIDKQTEFDNYVKTIEDERARERILQQEVLKQKESEYKERFKEQENKNKELERQLEEVKK